MRIALLAPATIRDFEPFLYEEYRHNLPKGMICSMITDLIKEYIKKGHEIVLCTLDSEIDSPRIYCGDRLTIFVGKLRTNGYALAFSMFKKEVNQMADYLKNCPPCDIYNAHWEYEFSLAALKVCPQRTIVTIRDWPWKVLKYNKNYYRLFRLFMAKRVFGECNYYTANSAYISDCMAEKYPDKNVLIVSNSIDITLANLHEKKLHSERHQIISVNNGFTSHKNGQTLLKAFKIIKDRDPNAELHLYGYESEEGGVANKLAQQYKIQEGIFFHGPVEHDKIMEAFRQADILIHPSFEESFGLVLIEAMLSKTPVIAGDKSGAVPWLLGNGRYGVLADVSDEKDIAGKAFNLLSDEGRYYELMNTAYQYVIDTFNAGKMAENYIKAYEWRLRYKGNCF